jgi:hypothetical protein
VQNGCAPEHNPEAGGGGGGGVPHPTNAVHPDKFKLLSETNTNVKQLEAPKTVPGETLPVYTPTKGDAVLGPLYM